MSISNKAIAGYKYVVNFLDEPVKIGSIYRMDDDQFIPAMHFKDAYPDVDLTRWIDAGAPGGIKFSAAKDVSLTFGASASSGLAESEVKVSFKKANSIIGALDSAIVESLGFQNIKPQLKELWSKQGFDKYRDQYVFVFSVVTAASGTQVYSVDKNNEVVLKSKLNEKVSKIADLASGQFEYVTNKKRTLEIIRPTAHKPLFKAFKFRSNWEPEILG